MLKKILSRKTVIASLVSLAVLALGGGIWYIMIDRGFSLTDNPAQTVSISEVRAPEESLVYDDKITPLSLAVIFDKPAARMDLVGKKLDWGISVYPAIRGTWTFENDSYLSFLPEKDWIPGTRFRVSLSPELFNPDLKIKDYDFSFESPAFNGKLLSDEFYEDPRDVKIKQAAASFRFDYPLNPESIRDNVSVKTVSGKTYDFTYKLTDAGRTLHILSAPLVIGPKEDFVNITIGKKLGNAYNADKLDRILTAEVKIPSSSTLFKLVSVNSRIVTNEQKADTPEQIVFVNFSTAVQPVDLEKNLAFYRLPEDCGKVRSGSGSKPWEKAGAEKLPLINVSPTAEAAKNFAFKIDVPQRGHCLAVRVQKGLNSVEGYLFNEENVSYLTPPVYPLQAEIAFDGSLIPLRGNPAVSFVSRGADTLNVEVARIRPDELNHLMTQTYGSYDRPGFNSYNFTEENISEIFRRDLSLKQVHPAEQNFSSLDLQPYLQGRKGIFLIKAKAVRHEGKQQYSSAEDRRLIVVTDLGIIVKDNLDNSHDLFVSDIVSGKPVRGAVVELLGKNGLPVLTRTTNENGEASFPDYKAFKDEKTPVVYKVVYKDSISFLPLQRFDRRLDFSRFAVDGIYENPDNPQHLNGYAFSDRGVYRPGETASFGLMVRSADLQVPANLPLRADITNSKGNEVFSRRLTADADGLMSLSYDIPAAAPTGTYNLYLYRVGSGNDVTLVTSVAFEVEEFTPDTLRMKVGFDNAPRSGWSTDRRLTAAVNLQNLYGNPAVGHKIKGQFRLLPAVFSFPEYAGYTFRDPLRGEKHQTVKTVSETLPEQTTDADGNAELAIDLSKFDQGAYRLILSVEGFELDSGRGVSGGADILVSPQPYLVGHKSDADLNYYLHKDSQHKVRFIAVDHGLKSIAPAGLQLEFYRRREISSLVEMPNGTYRYQLVPQEELIRREDFTLAEGGTDYVLNTSEPGDYVIRLIDDRGNIMDKVSYNVAGAGNSAYTADKKPVLSVRLDRSEYNSGDTINMRITAPYAGYGLITIERDKVYAAKWFKADKSSVDESIVLPEDVEGNAYVNVAWIRDIASPEIYMPPLSYAVEPFGINKSKRRVGIALGVPEIVKPGDEFVVSYRTTEPARLILWGANVGILQVAKYQTPDPLEYFLRKKALRVTTSQIMDLIMPDMNLVRSLKAPGGDDAYAEELLAANLNPFARKQDKPVAFWSGILNADGELRTYRYKVPETFSGEIKVMAVAVTAGRFGSAQNRALVRGDFALTPSGPFNVSPGDVFDVSLSVANLVENSGKAYPVKVSLQTTPGLEIQGSDETVLTLDEQEEAPVTFKVKALDELGAQTLTFTAAAVNDADKTARLPYSVGVRPASPYAVKLNMGFAKSSVLLKNFVEPMYAAFRVQQVEASASPLVLAQGLLHYLDKYPHFCTEQTVSKVFPAIDVFYAYPELVGGIDVYALYDDALAKLSARQNYDGGFGAWSGGSSSDEFVSLYTAQFLTFAKRHNFDVPDAMLGRLLGYVKGAASRDPQSPDDSNPAYAAYLLTANGEITTNYLLKLENYYKSASKDWKNSLSAAYIAAGYRLLQDKSRADSLISGYKTGRSQIDDARYVYLLANHFPEKFRSVSKPVLEALLKPLQQGEYNTISSAYSILALNAFSRDRNADKAISFAGKTADNTLFAAVDVTPADKELKITADRPFYYTVRQQGFFKQPQTEPLRQGLEVYKEYLDKDGKPISHARIGDEITVKISLRSLKGDNINDIAVVDLIPGCFEIVGNSINVDGWFDFGEIREDRALVYLTAEPKTRTVTYRAKVVARGEFVVPAVFANAMYDDGIQAHGVASRFVAE